MKRSEINAIIRDSEAFITAQRFYLPPFAYWTPEDWAGHAADAPEIAENRLGWDITDFARGDFEHYGLVLFTLRNGHPRNWETGQGKLYAEKVMIANVGQHNPLHFHWRKAEDIINRGGGTLMVELYNSMPDGGLAATDVSVVTDGVRRVVPAGGTVALRPGESITLVPGCYHRFWAEGDRVLMGEVSLVNDDNTDNRFYEPHARFPAIEEDEPPLYMLCSDYGR